jgi:predicted MFS family arabinose efflux permease
MLAWLSRDGRRLLAARVTRSFGYGFLAVALGSYLGGLGYGGVEVGLVLTVALGAAAVSSIVVGLRGDAWGRRRVLMVYAALMAAAGAILLAGDSLPFILTAVAVGTVSPTGGDIGPFVSLEQAMLPQAAEPSRRTDAFAVYNLAAALAASLGALFSGLPVFAARLLGLPAIPFEILFAAYAALGLLTLAIYASLSPAVEARDPSRASALSPASRGTVSRLAALFATDSFGGGFVVQSFVAFWFASVWGLDPVALAGVFFAANLLASLSFLAASRLAARFGLLNVMVFTHLPSSVLLMLVPLMPTLPLALAAYIGRMSLSQMDVPTRQSYTMTVVPPEDRTAAASFTTIARNLGQSASPGLGGVAFAAWVAAPFLLGGGIKIAYDLALLVTFRRVSLGSD